MTTSRDFFANLKSTSIGNLNSYSILAKSFSYFFLKEFKILNTQPCLFELHGIAKCLNLGSLERKI